MNIMLQIVEVFVVSMHKTVSENRLSFWGHGSWRGLCLQHVMKCPTQRQSTILGIRKHLPHGRERSLNTSNAKILAVTTKERAFLYWCQKKPVRFCQGEETARNSYAKSSIKPDKRKKSYQEYFWMTPCYCKDMGSQWHTVHGNMLTAFYNEQPPTDICWQMSNNNIMSYTLLL